MLSLLTYPGRRRAAAPGSRGRPRDHARACSFRRLHRELANPQARLGRLWTIVILQEIAPDRDRLRGVPGVRVRPGRERLVASLLVRIRRRRGGGKVVRGRVLVLGLLRVSVSDQTFNAGCERLRRARSRRLLERLETVGVFALTIVRLGQQHRRLRRRRRAAIAGDDALEAVLREWDVAGRQGLLGLQELLVRVHELLLR